MIGWVAKRHFGATTMYDLVGHGFLTESEYRELMEGQDHLWRIRFALHLISGRHEDRLLFEYQLKLANSLGYNNDHENLTVENFMQSYYQTVIQLNRLNEMLLQHFQEVILNAGKQEKIVAINRRFQTRNGYLEVIDNSLFSRYPLAMLELFLLIAQHPEINGIRANTIRLLRAHRHLVDEDRFRSDIKSRSLFMEIIRQPKGITRAMRMMNRHAILARYIPVFRNIVGRMQYDLYHVYTVDEHTLVLLRNLRRFSVPEHAQEFPLCSRIFPTLAKPELIYITGLFHDIAKGRGGDHSTLGAIDAWNFCKLHDLSEYDARLVAWLIEKHLLMSSTAQRQDLEDPEVIQEFADQVQDLSRLDYLYLLTVADMRASNPERWNSWKDALLKTLYQRTRHTIALGLEKPRNQDEVIQEKQEEARRLLSKKGINMDRVTQTWASLNLDYFQQSSPHEIAWQTEMVLQTMDYPSGGTKDMIMIRPLASKGCNEIFVCTMDRDHLFAETTAALDQLGLNILEARIQTADTGCAINTYFVLDDQGMMISDEAREEFIKERLLAQLELRQPPQLKPRRTPRKLKHFAMHTEVSINHEIGLDRTILELNTTDRPGLLSLIAEVFAAQGIRLHAAKIATVGAQAQDRFYISDRDNLPIQDADRLELLTSTLKSKLDQLDT